VPGGARVRPVPARPCLRTAPALPAHRPRTAGRTVFMTFPIR